MVPAMMEEREKAMGRVMEMVMERVMERESATESAAVPALRSVASWIRRRGARSALRRLAPGWRGRLHCRTAMRRQGLAGSIP